MEDIMQSGPCGVPWTGPTVDLVRIVNGASSTKKAGMGRPCSFVDRLAPASSA